MARGCYRYGHWEARYWFIGPEQGMAPGENHDIKLRCKAFRKLSKDGLSDCGVFHGFIRQTKWHSAAMPALQPTWKRLILLLMTFLKKNADNESLRLYQRDRFGRLDGETCVIELSGLPAKSLKEPGNRELFREKRIKFIRNKILAHKPAFVLMYGKGVTSHSKEITSTMLQPDFVERIGCTIFASAKHPVAHGITRQYWIDLAQRMKAQSPSASPCSILLPITPP